MGGGQSQQRRVLRRPCINNQSWGDSRRPSEEGGFGLERVDVGVLFRRKLGQRYRQRKHSIMRSRMHGGGGGGTGGAAVRRPASGSAGSPGRRKNPRLDQSCSILRRRSVTNYLIRRLALRT